MESASYFLIMYNVLLKIGMFFIRIKFFTKDLGYEYFSNENIMREKGIHVVLFSY